MIFRLSKCRALFLCLDFALHIELTDLNFVIAHNHNTREYNLHELKPFNSQSESANDLSCRPVIISSTGINVNS